jgi:nucleoside-diphosphate-sugar epimerase
MKKQERFFITGGMGYIGSQFARVALSRGDIVCLYDSLIYEQNISRILNEIKIGLSEEESCNLKLIIGDTRNNELLEKSILDFKPTYIMHWGDLSSVYSCNHNPIYTEQISVVASSLVVDLCEKHSIPLFYNSSSSLYGVQKENKLMKENDDIPTPTDQYTAVKLAMEQYVVKKLAANPNFKVIIFRPATVFGVSPRFRIELLPNHFTYVSMSTKNIKVADLNAYRAAIDIDDLISAYFKVIEVGTWKNFIYNLGSHNMSKLEFAIGIQKVIDTKITTIEDFGDLRNLQIDSTLFYDEFNFLPKYTYEQTILKIKKWLDIYKDEIQANNFVELLNMPLFNWDKLCK